MKTTKEITEMLEASFDNKLDYIPSFEIIYHEKDASYKGYYNIKIKFNNHYITAQEIAVIAETIDKCAWVLRENNELIVLATLKAQ